VSHGCGRLGTDAANPTVNPTVLCLWSGELLHAVHGGVALRDHGRGTRESGEGGGGELNAAAVQFRHAFVDGHLLAERPAFFSQIEGGRNESTELRVGHRTVHNNGEVPRLKTFCPNCYLPGERENMGGVYILTTTLHAMAPWQK